MPLSDLTADATEFVKKRWPSRSAALIASVIGAATMLLFLSGIDLTSLGLVEWSLVAAALIVPWLFWAISRRVPRHSKDAVGFGIAITYEDPGHGKKLRSDFVEALQGLLDRHEARYPFDVIEFSQHHTRQLRSKQDRIDFIQKSRGDLLIYGTAKSRVIDGSPQHVLELDGVVRHAPISNRVAETLANEFTEVLPRRLLIAEENDLFAFQVTASWLEIAARYIVGIAAFLSLDLEYAEELYSQLERELEGTQESAIPAVHLIRNRLPARIAEIHKFRLNQLGIEYRNTLDEAVLIRARPILRELQDYDSNYYPAHLFRAMCAFVLDRNTSEARSHLVRCRGIPDAVWRYSLAFIEAYEGNLHAAYRQYQKAFKTPLRDDSAALQSEEFMHMVLSKNPERGQLYFCLGLINERYKRDFAAARRDYQQFLAATDSAEYAKEHSLVRKWIGKIDGQLDGSNP